MEPFISVDAPPASDWESARPDDLHPQFWAETRPTEETLAQLSLPDGRVVHGSDGQLLGWESGEVQDCDLGALWVSCAQRFSDTGLWPICDAWEVDPYRRWNGRVGMASRTGATHIAYQAMCTMRSTCLTAKTTSRNLTSEQSTSANSWRIPDSETSP